MTNLSCSRCNKPAEITHGSYFLIESGLENVVLHGIELIHCETCGNDDPIIPKMSDLMRTIALAIVCKPYKLRGNEIRFLRKYIMKTGEELAQLLHVNKTTISKWENDDDTIGAANDRLLRLIVIALGDRLEPKLKTLVENFSQIDKMPKILGIEIDSSDMSHHYVLQSGLAKR